MQLPSEATTTLKVPSPQGNQCDRRPFICGLQLHHFVRQSIVDCGMCSVFPAEACETVGGEACDAEMYPEVKLKPEEGRSSTARTSCQQLDRDYLEYDSPKTVFPGDACDDLGGEFCEPEYQRGVN